MVELKSNLTEMNLEKEYD
jgi:glutamyl-tRNA synthetase